MANIIQFVPKQNYDATKNLAEFVQLCREKLTVFGSDLKWEENYWPTANITFGNLNQKTRLLDPANTMQQPFLDFAKAYYRYQQGHKPTKAHTEIRALKCIERALLEAKNKADILSLNSFILDKAAILVKQFFSPGAAYRIGCEITRLGNFVSDKNLIPGRLDWKNPISRPIDTVRTGIKAQQQRERKLPNEALLNALADIFASNPTEPRDIFTSSVCAMLLCAPSRISEILSLPLDCEVWQAKKDGSNTYGWRFQPGKGGNPCIKWIPDAMISIAQEAISRIKKLTDETRKIAKWYEDKPHLFYRHQNCPKVTEEQLLTSEEVAKANSHQFRHLLNTMAQRGGLSQSEISRWSGRADIKQNRVYDHMSEFELVDMIRSHDNALSLDQPLEEIAEQIASKIPMTRQEFNTLAMPTAHITEYGFCIHDFTMSPCQRFRDCLNCTEQVCVKGDRRIDRLKERYAIVEKLRDKAAQEIKEGTAGADRWYQIHDLTEKRLRELISIMENPAIQNGAVIKLRNENEFSPLRRAIETRTQKNEPEQPLIEDMQKLLGGGLG